MMGRMDCTLHMGKSRSNLSRSRTEQDPREGDVGTGEGTGPRELPPGGLGVEWLVVEVSVDPPPPGRDPGLDHEHRPARLDASAPPRRRSDGAGPDGGARCVMTIARRPPSRTGMAWASMTSAAPGVEKISEVIRPGMNSPRNPAPEPSSSDGTVARRQGGDDIAVPLLVDLAEEALGPDDLAIAAPSCAGSSTSMPRVRGWARIGLDHRGLFSDAGLGTGLPQEDHSEGDSCRARSAAQLQDGFLACDSGADPAISLSGVLEMPGFEPHHERDQPLRGAGMEELIGSDRDVHEPRVPQ